MKGMSKLGAETMDNVNVSRNRRFNSSGTSSNIRSRLSFWWFNLRISCSLRRMQRERSELIKEHCDKGYHRLSRATFEAYYKNSVWKVEYLECKTCGKYLFFSTAKDKRKYLRMKSRKRWNKWKEVKG